MHGRSKVKTVGHSPSRADEATVPLTSIGRPFLTGYELLGDGGRFVAYGDANREVSWVVYPERDDPTTRQLTGPVEKDKGPDNKLCDRGQMLSPAAYGRVGSA
ncbi:MAG: hypothetical protein KJ749_03050 [Planctomycetes bacterium]|nr:hypothetical protein [Planctomycetota bacterium]